MSEQRYEFDNQPDWYADPQPTGRRSRRRLIARLLAGLALIAVVAIFVEVVLVSYDRHDEPGEEGVAPLVRADLRPTRVRPEQPGGLQVPHQDRLVLQDIGGDEPPMAVVTLRPPPEQPVLEQMEPAAGESDSVIPATSSEMPEGQPVETPREPLDAAEPEPSGSVTATAARQNGTGTSLPEPDRLELAELVADVAELPPPSDQPAAPAPEPAPAAEPQVVGDPPPDAVPAPQEAEVRADRGGPGPAETSAGEPLPLTPIASSSDEAEVLIPRQPEASPLELRTGPMLAADAPAPEPTDRDIWPDAYDQPLTLTRRLNSPGRPPATEVAAVTPGEVVALGTFAPGPIAEQALAGHAVEDRPVGLERTAQASASARPAPVVPVAGGGHRVQLAAYDSEATARSQWQQFVQQFPDLLEDLEMAVPTVQVGGQTWYRLQAGPLDEPGARQLCAALQARGADCLVR